MTFRTGVAKDRGFSLLELLIAMSLFMVLGAGLVALVSRALDFLESGTAGSEVIDKGADFLTPFVEDIQNVVVERTTNRGEPTVRFLCDFVPIDSDGDKMVDYYAQRLAFVRSTSREGSDPIARRGGEQPAPKAYLDGRDDLKEAESGKLKAAGGLTEVIYMAIPDDPKDPGSLTLYRGTRAPVGGEGSLLDRRTVKKPEDLRKVAQPLLTGVLHFGVRFWTPDTTSWEGDYFGRRSADSPSPTWDSTRGILPAGLGRNEFAFFRGEESFADPRDDISPRMVEVTFVFERTGRETRHGTLMAGIDDSTRSISVDSTDFANTSPEQFIKIGTEWIAYAGSTTDSFTAQARGVRNTTPRSHDPGSRVVAGHTVVRRILIPSYREDWNFRNTR